MTTMHKSDKLQREEAVHVDDEVTITSIPVARPPQGRLKIKPLETVNDWVLLLPIQRDTTILVPESITDLPQRAVVIGCSKTVLAPNGQRISSCVSVGDVVYYMTKSILRDEIKLPEPYDGQRVVAISERNILFKLDRIPFDLV